ncbi:phosphodiester glycosidase family protein [Coleofasciculus sp. E1-EBD-02]|uniref:phosphodiester glycosidase family protein n=1 Tax=Coleofasciculus sp. E1-EBD-02 TaxID=3068481 RepID=UPI0032F20894
MNHRNWINWKQFFIIAGMGILAIPLILYSRLISLRPPRTDVEKLLFQGIVYKRDVRLSPRPLVIHRVTIDLTAPGVKVFVTPGTPTSDNTVTNARTTSEFVREFKLQLAINANFFYLFREKTPWDYYPHSGDRTTVIGQAISNGNRYSPPKPNWSALCFLGSDRAQIVEQGNCPEGTVQAVAGNRLFVNHSKPVTASFSKQSNNKPYSRIAVAVDQQGQKLWLIAVDGKQPFYSEGVTLAELAEIVINLGADQALNLDGGGSSTLVMATSSGTTVLNAPIHTKLPMVERPVANHLGFYALPATENQ